MSRRTANPRPKREASGSPTPDEKRLELTSRRYLKQAHKASRGFRSEFTYRECLKVVSDAPKALREAEAELAASLERAAAKQEAALAKLRADRRRASPLMIGICRMEGFEPATVAAAILPEPIRTHASDGHPWLSTGSGEHQSLAMHLDKSGTPPLRNRVSLRKRPDPRGGLAVSQVRGTLEVKGRIGDALIETRGGTATLALTQPLPETILTAMPGRPISKLVDHPLLADPAYVVLSASNLRGLAVLTFACPNVPCLEWDALGAGPPYLHSDPALSPWAAMCDVVGRARMVRGRTRTIGPAVELLHAQHHVRQINLSRPPEHQLPAPTAQVVGWFNGNRAADAA